MAPNILSVKQIDKKGLFYLNKIIKMIIAKKGKYILQHKTFLGRNKKTTYTIEICKEIGNSIITVCTLNKNSKDLISCENRLLSTIENIEDLQNIKILVDILYLIIHSTEEIEIKE